MVLLFAIVADWISVLQKFVITFHLLLSILIIRLRIIIVGFSIGVKLSAVVAVLFVTVSPVVAMHLLLLSLPLEAGCPPELGREPD